MHREIKTSKAYYPEKNNFLYVAQDSFLLFNMNRFFLFVELPLFAQNASWISISISNLN